MKKLLQAFNDTLIMCKIMAQQAPLTPYAGSLKPGGNNHALPHRAQSCNNE